MVKGAPDYTGIVNKVIRPDIYREVAKEMSVAVPKEDIKKEMLFDKVEFDPSKPEEYVKKFAVSNLA
jgi:predicted RNA methylase